MTAILTEDFDGFSGTITAVNSAFDTATGAGTFTAATSTDVAKTGTQSAKVTVGASGSYWYGQLTGITPSDTYVRMYVYVPAGGVGSSIYFLRCLNSTPTQIYAVRVNTGSTAPVVIQNSNSVVAATSTSINFTSGRWIRVEVYRKNASADGELRVAWGSYLDSAITGTTGDANNGTYASGTISLVGTTATDRFRFGITSAPTTATTIYLDACVIDNATWVGPASTPALSGTGTIAVTAIDPTSTGVGGIVDSGADFSVVSGGAGQMNAVSLEPDNTTPKAGSWVHVSGDFNLVSLLSDPTDPLATFTAPTI